MFYLLRHGQTDWNQAARLQGMTDIPLNDTGRLQARRAGEVMQSEPISRIIVSPLSRAFETAAIVGGALGLEPVIDTRLVERNFGAFEGLDLDEVQMMRLHMPPEMNPEPDRDGKHYPFDAERLESVYRRVIESLEEHTRASAGCLFVTHGIPFRVVTRHYLGAMHSSPNAAPVRLAREGEDWQMRALDPLNPPVHASRFDGATTMGRL